MFIKPFKVHSPDGKHFYEGDAPTPVVRPVTPMTCPKCNALWLFWPKEQSGFEHDSLNLRSEKSCDFCEPAGVEQLESLNRVEPTAPPPASTNKLTEERIWKLWCSLPTVGSVDEDIMVFARAIIAATEGK